MGGVINSCYGPAGNNPLKTRSTAGDISYLKRLDKAGLHSLRSATNRCSVVPSVEEASDALPAWAIILAALASILGMFLLLCVACLLVSTLLAVKIGAYDTCVYVPHLAFGLRESWRNMSQRHNDQEMTSTRSPGPGPLQE
ncbi:hypothetical protein NDU88_013122 [Pleurodeles waltl]|uniref:Uncharacterized protein n=1 Tax=Pleurodeles waltl TaxID=8319 RepID=A0AAV7R250_PLEWA|nr:hypothetical protein NDU88_013122 [Pleurodeles waltl]